MKKHFLLFMLIVAVSLFVQACADKNITTEPTPAAPKSCYLTNQCVFLLPSQVQDSTLMGYINFSAYRSQTKSLSNGKINYFSENLGLSWFCTKGFTYLIGDFMLNGDTLKARCIQPECVGCTGECFYEISKDSIKFDEQIFKWFAVGIAVMLPFEIQLQTPKSISKIIYPPPCSYIRKQDTLVITWDGEHQPGKNLVRIKLNSISYYTDDTGSFTIPPKDLSKFTNGKEIRIELYVGRNTVYKYSSTKFIYTEIYSQYMTNYVLTD